MIPMLKFPKVQFDFGAIKALPDELTELRVIRPLVMTDQGLVRCGVFAKVRDAMAGYSGYVLFDQTPENPTIEGVERAFAAYSEGRCDAVVAVGGGSVIDSAKAVAVLGGQSGPIDQYLGHPEKITSKVAPLVAVPTTAGTGSEASRGAGIHPDSTSRSLSIGGPHLVPRVAICDPELTLTLPPFLTAGTGMDALSHCVEGFLANPVNPVLDAIALDGIRRVLAWIERAVSNGKDREARWNMMMAGLEGGMSITKGLGPGHALGGAFGDQGLHHGVLVTLCMPTVLRLLLKHAAAKMDRLAKAMSLGSGDRLPESIQAMNKRVGLPSSLRALGYAGGDMDGMVDYAVHSPFNDGSPYRPTQTEYRSMILEIMG